MLRKFFFAAALDFCSKKKFFSCAVFGDEMLVFLESFSFSHFLPQPFPN